MNKADLIQRIKNLTLQEKFKIVEALEVYPKFSCSEKDFNIDEDWIKNVMDKITSEKLEKILNNTYCKYCEGLNEEKEEIRMEEIYIEAWGYFRYECPVKYCPNCGTILNKYKKEGEKI